MEQLVWGLQITVVGMGLVFALLGLLASAGLTPMSASPRRFMRLRIEPVMSN